ncbi:hypothetical protein MRB53_016310 [Persea americana]|uniref:Uncharacterized protein n=1 Tax=Persea americana TaxID=3435 RepID=A0ACC2M1Y3_PERAE|nr:hypothetical protein MRB53_016310 [Persea americana]
MSATSAAAFKLSSMANTSISPLSTLFCPKTLIPFLSIPSKAKLLHLSHSTSSVPSWVSLKSKLSSSGGSFIALVARTSDWARQDEDNEIGEAGFDWEGEGTEAQVSDWEGEVEEDGEVLGESGAEDEEESGEVGFADEEDSYSAPPEEVKIFVGNLPFDLESADLADLFNKAGVVESAEVIYNRETDQSRGFGFVSMSTVEEVVKAIEMFDRYDINGRTLTVNKAAPRGSRAERPPRDFEPAFRVYVGNIPWQVDNLRLEQLFSEYGKVEEARIVFDRETGRSRGFGFVTMSSQIEMEDAIAALDGSNLDGRAIKVSMAQERPRRGHF